MRACYWLRAFVVMAAGLLIAAAPVRVDSVSAAEGAVSPAAKEFLRTLGNSISEAAEVAKPSVVNISTTTTVSMEQHPFGEFFDNPLFKKFFGDEFGQPGQQKKFKSAALGSGVIISSDGYILTNNHVVENADEIIVTLGNKKEFKGKVIGTDPPSEIAVIKIDAKDLPAIKVGKSRDLRAGDVVIAIGNPFGLNQTITMGIVSAVGREDIGISDYEDYIQTDAAINPGNSGGALVNYNGELVGINTAIFSTLGGNIGIGFAISSEMANRVAQSILKHGRVIRGWLGVSIQDLTPELAQSFGIKEEKGALVTEVLENSPAERAGFRRGDLIVSYGGKAVENGTALKNMVANTAPGTTVPLTVRREGKTETITATIGELPAATAKKGPERPKAEEQALRGVEVQELTPAVRERLDIAKGIKGVVVAKVDPGSPARGVLAPGDVIVEVNRTPVASVKEYRQIVSKAGAGENILLLVNRKGRYLYVTVTK